MQRGVPSDQDEAIDLHRAALVLRPHGHPDRSITLNNLALSLQDRFEERSVLADLDEAIDLHRAALALCPLGHPYQSMSLNNLALSLQARYKYQGVPSDLDEAIKLHRASLALSHPGHSNRSSSLNNLAISLRARFEQQFGDSLSDLNEVIDLHRAALALRPPGHSGRSSSLNNLANSLQVRFEEQNILSDLDEAIDLHRAALTLRPHGHSDRSLSLNNLANSLQARFEQWSVLSDLDEAIDLHQAALALCPPGHSNRSSSLNRLALSLRAKFKHLGIMSDLDEVFRHYAELSHVSHAVSYDDLRAAKEWAASAEMLMHGSALAAYQTALRFLDDWQHIGGLSSSLHHFEVVREVTSSLAMDAFSCSVRNGAFTTAVELVEQGRAVFWTQLARFHTPLEEISASCDIGKALAAEFKELSFHLRNMLENSITEDKTAQIRQLTIQRDDVISRIRMLPDFSCFLLPPLFSDLQKAAEDGPVIIVNASQYSCDTMIVLSTQDPIHVSLDIAQAEVLELSTRFQSLTADVGSSDNKLENQNIIGVLRELWTRIVSPIVHALRALKVRRRSRIWWCPTAEFVLLPLHAAGPYKEESHNFSHFYISSYTPTLAALIRARQQVARDTSTPQFVAIGQGNPSEGKELPRVAAELDDVAQRVAPILPTTLLMENDATVHGALDALSRNQWLHLACHGMPNRKKPFESSFAMRDGLLTITDIIRPHLRNLQPEFAFLSACHTTVGHTSSPDEAIHLAAAMQFSGFRSVIGSMWSVDDEIAGHIVCAFYDHLVDTPGKLDPKRAAVALHKAVKKLRKEISLEQQIVFVHIGI